MAVFWGLYHQRQAADAQRAAGRAETRVTELRAQLRLVEDKLESLALLCQAQWELIRDHTKLTEEHIEAKVMEIDLRDGQADGKMGRGETSCSQCQRPLHRRHRRCLYCGNEVSEGHRFQV